jgi:hemerythrin-like metal-binding protein
MESLIQWNDNFSVHIPLLDDQHKELINILNIMKAAVDAKKDKAAQEYIIQKMMEYSIFHFTSEEEIMRNYDFPELNEHMKEHEEYIRHTTQINYHFNNQEETVSAEILAVLNIWWKKHIPGSDQKYGEFLKGKIK